MTCFLRFNFHSVTLFFPARSHHGFNLKSRNDEEAYASWWFLMLPKFRNIHPIYIYIYISYTFNQIQIPLDNLFWYQYTGDGLAIWGLSLGMMEFFNSTIICCFACRDPEDWQLYSPWRFGNCRGSGWVENKPKQHQIAETHEELLGAKNWGGREKALKHIKTHCL